MSIPNPLHRFVSYNYRWRLSVLTQDEFNTGDIGFNSGVALIETGGFPDKTITTAVEQALGVNVEYFIEDVNIEYLHQPNPGTGYGNVIQADLTITEPYSVGLFFQSLAIAAAQVNHTNYLNAPFMLACEFVGYDDSGSVSVIPGSCICLKLVDMRFSVEASGSVYNLNAIPYNHVAFTDTFQNTRTTTAFSGATVGEVLNEFVTELNRQEYQKSQQGLVVRPDAYRIEFPADVSNITGGENTYTAAIQSGEDAQRGSDIQKQINAVRNSRSSGLSTDEELKAFHESIGGGFARFKSLDPNERYAQEQEIAAQRTSRARAAFNPSLNEIGNSAIVNNFNDFGINDFGDNRIVWNEERRVWQRGGMSISETERRFQFTPGMKIERIIEEVILTSDYGKSLLQQVPVNEMVSWFKISTKTFIADVQEDQVSGRPAYELVYVVTPYRVHASSVSQITTDFNYIHAMDNAQKAYRYSYTGDNADILDFTFTIDNSFYKELATTANVPTNVQEGGSITNLQNNNQYSPTVQPLSNPTSRIMRANRVNFIPLDVSGGAGVEDNAVRAARIFNANILNSDVDNIELEIKIWGDPFYLNDSDARNRSAEAGPEGVNIDGTVDFQRGEVFILVDFKSAVDYNGNLLHLDPVNQFSGIYKLVSYTNNFSNGLYSNTLSLLRMANQPSASVLRIRNILNGVSSTVNNNLLLEDISSVANNEFRPLLQKAQQFQEAYTHFQNLNIESLDKIAPGNLNQVLNKFDNLISEARQIESNIQKTLAFVRDPLAGINDLAKNFKKDIDNIFKGLQ